MKIIGHRGARGLAPENTIASLQKGLEHHVDELEFDLRVTKDDIVILSHDHELHDASGTALEIAAHTYEELKAHKPDLATFQEILDYVDTKCHLYIEVKPGVATAPIVNIIRQYLKSDTYSAEDLSLGSFSQKILRELHKELPEIQKVVIESWSGVRARWRTRELGTKQLCMNKRWLWSGFIAAVHRSGYDLYAYTLNDPKKARRWAKHGLAGVVTDFPDRFER
jgi:glycerophosphoryl diester phosphodiesterase